MTLAVQATGVHKRLSSTQALAGVMSHTIEMSELRKRYGAKDVVAGVSLDIGPGVTGLLGPNGAGKTTLMRMLATVLAPTGGYLRLLGRDPEDADERTELRRQLGYMPQEPGFHRHFTAFEFVDYVAILKEMTDTRARHRDVRRVLESVGLGDVAGRRIRKLSGGMRKRVALAQALLGDPQLLVLDEPASALDPEQRMRFRELISGLGDGRIVLVSTHQTDDVAALCQRVIVLRDGHAAFDGTPGELSALARDRVWIADTRDDRAQLSWRTAEGRHRHVGDPPAGARLVEPTIEDGYLLLAGPAAVTEELAA
jgi:ABC-2 type transport system ATP-binding protein